MITTIPELRSADADVARRSPARLAVVRHCELLDTCAEDSFDSLTRLATQLINVPVSFLSVVDETRDFYKSQYGFPEPLASTRQSEGRTFCHYTLARNEPLVIDDTHADPVWREVSTVRNLGSRAYLGVPVVIEGQAIGSFCVIDSQPRSWTALEIETLVQLSRMATREIELKASLKLSRAETDRAHALAKANEEMLAVVVHDLRSPLQAIGLSASLIARLADDTVQPHVDRLIKATDSMRHLVNELVTDYVAKSAERANRSVVVTERE